ncbi:MAG TPA: PxKF domain-containing protein [Burkholderiales bacterium]|nr:PxKF domain-containing protein [Burkholderiales bacterium]
MAERVQSLGTDLPTLVVGGDGNVYGTAGTQIFKIDAAGTYTVVYTVTPSGAAIWQNTLVKGNDGALYGLVGGNPTLTPNPLLLRLDMQGMVTQTSIALPSSGSAFKLVKSSDGAFYSSLGDRFVGEIRVSYGAVARITSNGSFTMVGGSLYTAHAEPMAIGGDGALYGARSDRYNFPGKLGGLIRWDTAGQATMIHEFTSTDEYDEYYPTAMTLAPDGLLYAVSGYPGTIFRFDSSGNIAVMHHFDYYTDGVSPTTLTIGSDGALYGGTREGGPLNDGTVFRLATDGNFSTLLLYDFSNGSGTDFDFVAAQNGALYTMSANQLIRITPPSTIDSFAALTQGWADGPLVQGSDCGLYGVGFEYVNNSAEFFVYRAFEAGQLCQRIDFAALPDRTLGEPPFGLGASSSSTLPVSFSASGSCTVKDEQVTLAGGGVCTITASQPGDARFRPADEVSQSFDVRFDFTGFLPPVTDPPAVNRVKAGRTVPIRFRLGGDAGRDVLAAGSPRVRPVDCDASAPVNDVAGGFWAGPNRLLHFPRTRAYTYLWKTEKSWAGTCQELSLELVDGSVHRAVFRFERPRRPARKAGEKK